MTLAALRAEAVGCTRCDLACARTQVVFGEGPARADLMIVGEAPGATEDAEGVPFVGRSGRLLESVLAEVGWARDEVFITNIVKCRPPENRNPRNTEIDACAPYLRFQITIIDPKVVVALGNFASRFLLETRDGITRLRGRAYPGAGRTVIPTYHPAAALRQGAAVRNALRDDLALARARIEDPP